jgi:hypothetical protein
LIHADLEGIRRLQTDGSSNYGPHSNNTGNQLDPLYNLDQGHQSAADNNQSSSNHRPQGSSMGAKLDLRYDAGVNQHHPGVSGNYGPQDPNIGNKLDPSYDSELGYRRYKTGSSKYEPHGGNAGNELEPRYGSDLDDRDHGTHDDPHWTMALEDAVRKLILSSTREQGHAMSNNGNSITPERSDNYEPGAEAGVQPPYQSSVSNKLDPRVDFSEDGRH